MYQHNQLYQIDVSSRHLLSKSSIDTSQVKVTGQTIAYDAGNQKPIGHARVTIAAPTDSTCKTGYQATINTAFKRGLSFGDSSSGLSNSLLWPIFHNLPLDAWDKPKTKIRRGLTV